MLCVVHRCEWNLGFLKSVSLGLVYCLLWCRRWHWCLSRTKTTIQTFRPKSLAANPSEPYLWLLPYLSPSLPRLPLAITTRPPPTHHCTLSYPPYLQYPSPHPSPPTHPFSPTNPTFCHQGKERPSHLASSPALFFFTPPPLSPLLSSPLLSSPLLSSPLISPLSRIQQGGQDGDVSKKSLGRFLDWGLRVQGWGFGWGRVSVRD